MNRHEQKIESNLAYISKRRSRLRTVHKHLFEKPTFWLSTGCLLITSGWVCRDHFEYWRRDTLCNYRLDDVTNVMWLGVDNSLEPSMGLLLQCPWKKILLMKLIQSFSFNSISFQCGRMTWKVSGFLQMADFVLSLVSNIRRAFWVPEWIHRQVLILLTGRSKFPLFHLHIPQDSKSSMRLRHLKKGARICSAWKASRARALIGRRTESTPRLRARSLATKVDRKLMRQECTLISWCKNKVFIIVIKLVVM